MQSTGACPGSPRCLFTGVDLGGAERGDRDETAWQPICALTTRTESRESVSNAGEQNATVGSSRARISALNLARTLSANERISLLCPQWRRNTLRQRQLTQHLSSASSLVLIDAHHPSLTYFPPQTLAHRSSLGATLLAHTERARGVLLT